jgi:hypothetical protein
VLGVATAGFGEGTQLRAGVGGDECPQLAAHARPSAGSRRRHLVAPEQEREAGIRGDVDRRPRRDARRVELERHGSLLARVEPPRRLFEANGRVDDRGRAGEAVGGTVSRFSCSSSGGCSVGAPLRVKRARPGASKAARSASLSVRSTPLQAVPHDSRFPTPAAKRSPRGERAGATFGATCPPGPAGSRRGRRGRPRPPR